MSRINRKFHTALISAIVCFSLSAGVFDNARWIGVPNDSLPLSPFNLPVFTIEYIVDIPDAKGKASLIYGANDPRLMDSTLNIHRLSSEPWDAGDKKNIQYHR